MSVRFAGSLRPRKMKEIEFTVLSRDMDAVLEFLGRSALLHLKSGEGSQVADQAGSGAEASAPIRQNLDKLISASKYLNLPLPKEPLETSRFPGESEGERTNAISGEISSLCASEKKAEEEKQKLEGALNEAKAFSNLDAPFSDLDQLSFLTLRIGRLDPKRHSELKENLSDRAVLIPLGEGGDKVLAASSRKGRFALDSELRKMDFLPMAVPEGFKGVPSELLSGLENRLKAAAGELTEIKSRKEKLKEEYGAEIQSLAASYLMADIAEQIKARLTATRNAFILSGWVPEDSVKLLVEELGKVTQGRIAIRSFDPEEIPAVKEGREKVPVSLNHGVFVKGFETLVFSYGAPLYGTIDPTPFVAISFTLLFGIMFGDLGQGFVLFLLGFLTGKRGPLARFRKFSVPLIAVGISSMAMGFLNGEFFTNEEILSGPIRLLSGFISGRPVDRFLTIMPLAEKGGSIVKLAFFFGFTLAVGALLNSAGLIVNTVNLLLLRKYEKALFEKTGLAGILLFWYAIFMALRFAAAITGKAGGFSLHWYDLCGLFIPAFAIFMGPALWRLVSGERPVFIKGITVYIVEGFVEILETVSTYVSNTVSFLRVGAFALSHAVLAYIVFRFSEEISVLPAGTAFGLLILVFGNLVIILLEGMIVAIQVVRLQYYEFFSKFFTETGVEFSPFCFRKVQ